MGLKDLFKTKKEVGIDITLNAITTGVVKSITEAPDEAFSGKMLGDGYVIFPESNNICSPVDGEVTVIFPSLHAYGIKTNDGVEILIHIGLDSYKLGLEDFTLHTKIGAKVKKGDLLVEAHFEKFAEKGINTATPVVITNIADLNINVNLIKEGNVSITDEVLTVKNK